MRLFDLYEGRDGYLYHAMDVVKTLSVFESDTMEARWKHLIDDKMVSGNSFSRSPTILENNRVVCLKINHRRLSYDHKIIPLDGEMTFMKTQDSIDKVSANRSGYRDRIINSRPLYEEFVIGDIRGLHRYIEEILIRSPKLYFINPHNAKLILEASKTYSEKYNVSLNIHPYFEERIKREEYLMTLDESVKEEFFIRFGDLPKSGKSKIGPGTNPLALWGREDTDNEAGVSVWETEFNKNKNRWVIHAGNYASLAELFAQARPIYLVKGEIVGYGSDGEPVISDATIIKKLSPKEVDVPGWSDDDWIPQEPDDRDPLTIFYEKLNQQSVKERGSYLLLNDEGEYQFSGQTFGFGDIAERLEIKNSIPQTGIISDKNGREWRAYWNNEGNRSVKSIINRFGDAWKNVKSMMIFRID